MGHHPPPPPVVEITNISITKIALKDQYAAMESALKPNVKESKTAERENDASMAGAPVLILMERCGVHLMAEESIWRTIGFNLNLDSGTKSLL